MSGWIGLPHRAGSRSLPDRQLDQSRFTRSLAVQPTYDPGFRIGGDAGETGCNLSADVDGEGIVRADAL